MVGTAIGSFLGVVIVRQTTNDKRQTTNIGGRSRCGSCKKQLKWLDNIPLVSYVFLRGKCRTCRSPIPYWLPLIELAGGIGGIWVIREIGEIGVMGGIGAMLIAAALVWTLFSDLVYGVIPDLAIGIGAFGAILEKFAKLHTTIEGFANFIWPAAAAAGFFLFLVVITRGRGMGTGDVTLAAFLGLWLGWPKILPAIWLAFVLGAIVGLVLIGLKLKRFGQTIPFGPFMIAGSIIAEIWGLTLLQLFLTI